MLSAISKSVRYKVMAVILAATLAAMLTAAAALLTYEVRNYRSFLINDVTTQAGILARMNAPTLAFDDPESAEANLALLDNRRDILSAAVYTSRGELFATYSRDGIERAFPPMAPVNEPQIAADALTLFHPVVEEGNVLGSVYLQAQYELTGRLQDYAFILGGVLLVGMLVAALVSLPLQRSITAPVMAVGNVARRIMEQRDFSLRARKTTEDEIGVLVDAFNGMLAEVGERQDALEQSNRKLRQETDERRNAEDALRSADRRKDEFLATLAHELRNPLAPMVNALHLMKSEHGGAAITERAQDIIERQLAHMVRLVEDLLDVSRITRGRLTLRKERVALAAVIHSAVDTVRPLLDERGQRLEVTVPQQPIHVMADPVRVSQVVSNLLNNAARYSGDGGNIALTVSLQGGAVLIAVSDDGMGIEPDKLDEIFDMFAQGAVAPEQTQAGLGVGLALAKRLAELHGGSVKASSPGAGGGSRFTVSLPALEPAPEAERAPLEALECTAAARAKAHRILLVDDNVDFATSLQLLLEGLGHEVRVAHDASEALAAAREFAPEFAFLDIGLPRISGYELAEQLRALSSAMVLVALSGWGQEQDRRRAEAAGFAMHLVKPVELARVRAALGALAPA